MLKLCILNRGGKKLTELLDLVGLPVSNVYCDRGLNLICHRKYKLRSSVQEKSSSDVMINIRTHWWRLQTSICYMFQGSNRRMEEFHNLYCDIITGSIARQWLGKHVSMTTDAHATITEILGSSVFCSIQPEAV
jgi:hypothetical protein